MDIIGKKFGQLKVLEKTEIRANNNGEYKYKCECTCGKITFVRKSNLKSGNSKTCGYCNRSVRHSPLSNGLRSKNKRLYSIYQNMKQRCYDENSITYKNYGKRGIKICDEWLNDYSKFYNWSIENNYQNNLSIDRINNDGDYCPQNCRWATKEEQQNNTRNNRKIKYNNEIKTLAQWAKILNMSQQKLRYRLNNWSIEEAFKK